MANRAYTQDGGELKIFMLCYINKDIIIACVNLAEKYSRKAFLDTGLGIEDTPSFKNTIDAQFYLDTNYAHLV